MKTYPNRPSFRPAFFVGLAAAGLLSVVGAEAQLKKGVWFQKFVEPQDFEPNRKGYVNGTLEATFHEVNIQLPIGHHSFWSRIYNQDVPGPAFKALPGDTLRIRLINNLIDPRPDSDPNKAKEKKYLLTNLHTHGFHVNPGSTKDKAGNIIRASDDVLLTVTPPGWQDDPAIPIENGVKEQLQYEFRIPPYHAPGTHWYHPHRHGSTAKQVEN
ncbi:MAG: hypothetical protein AAF492_17810, partial [Verrucomicrobiota bacterium]